MKQLRYKAVEQKTLSSPYRIARRYGTPVLLLACTPIIGDALCAAAGWLRLPWLSCMLWMAAGKAARYALVVAGAGLV